MLACLPACLIGLGNLRSALLDGRTVETFFSLFPVLLCVWPRDDRQIPDAEKPNRDGAHPASMILPTVLRSEGSVPSPFFEPGRKNVLWRAGKGEWLDRLSRLLRMLGGALGHVFVVGRRRLADRSIHTYVAYV